MLYRRKPKPNWLAEVRRRIVGPEGGERGSSTNGSAGPRLIRREPITLRVLRDIPGAPILAGSRLEGSTAPSVCQQVWPAVHPALLSPWACTCAWVRHLCWAVRLGNSASE